MDHPATLSPAPAAGSTVFPSVESHDVLTPFPLTNDPHDRHVSATTVPLTHNALILPRSIVGAMQDLVQMNQKQAITNMQLLQTLRSQQNFVAQLLQQMAQQFLHIQQVAQPAFENDITAMLQKQAELYAQFRSWGLDHLWKQ
jgi:hypothetical protein